MINLVELLDMVVKKQVKVNKLVYLKKRQFFKAQVWIKEGTGNFFINGRKMIEYIPEYLRPVEKIFIFFINIFYR